MPRERTANRPSPYRWLVFGLLAFAYLLVYFHRLSPAVVALDLMRDLSVGGAIIGVLGSAYFYPYALMQLPAGLLSDSWGPRRTVTASFVLAGLASIVFGLSSSAGMAIVARGLVGLGVAFLFVPTMKILTHWFRKEEFSMMTGLLMAVGGLGVLSASAPLAFMSDLLGWRGSFIVIGGVTLVLAAAIWVLVRNTPQEKGLPAAEEVPAAAAAEPLPEAISLGRGMKMVLTRRSFWPLAVWFFFTCGIFFSFGGLWGGPYLMQVYGLSKGQAGGVLTMLAVAMIVGSPGLSYISDHVIKSRKKLIVGASVIITAITAVITFAPGGLNLPLLYVFCFLLSLGASAIVVIGFTSCKELFPVSIAGTSVGLINFFPFFGGAVMQPVLGAVLDAAGPAGGPYPPESYAAAFAVCLASAVIALVASLLVEETLRD